MPIFTKIHPQVAPQRIYVMTYARTATTQFTLFFLILVLAFILHGHAIVAHTMRSYARKYLLGGFNAEQT
jgi:hypothetical protein